MGTRLKVVTTTGGGKKLDRMMRIETEDGSIRIDLKYAPMNVDYSGFGRVWTEIERPGRNPLVVSTGLRNRTLSFDVDMVTVGMPSQWTPLETIRKLSETTKRIKISYAGFDTRLWHLTDYSFTSEQRRASDSAITRATASLSFIAVADAVGQSGPVSGGVKPSTSSKPKATSKTKTKTTTSSSKKRYHIVKSGQTLSGIAVTYYRDASKWRKIADANKIKNPNLLKVGQKLYIP